MMRNSLKEIKIKMENFEAVMKYVTQINKLLKSGDQAALHNFIWQYELENSDVYDKIYQNAKLLIKKKLQISLSII